MKNLHRSLLGVALLAVIAVSFGFAQPWIAAAEAQHGHVASDQEHFATFASELELTDGQKEAVAGPFREAVGALENLHRLHGLILAELTEEQQAEFGEMVHSMVGASFSGEGHGH